MFEIFKYDENQNYETNLNRYIVMTEHEYYVLKVNGFSENYDRQDIIDGFHRKYRHKDKSEVNPIHYIT